MAEEAEGRGPLGLYHNYQLPTHPDCRARGPAGATCTTSWLCQQPAVLANEISPVSSHWGQASQRWLRAPGYLIKPHTPGLRELSSGIKSATSTRPARPPTRLSAALGQPLPASSRSPIGLCSCHSIERPPPGSGLEGGSWVSRGAGVSGWLCQVLLCAYNTGSDSYWLFTACTRRA